MRQVDVAVQIGITPSAVAHLIAGRTLPSLITAVAIEELTKGAVPCASWLAAA